jgi:hypothetical protein
MKFFTSTGDTTVSTGPGVLIGTGVAPVGNQTPASAGVQNGDITQLRIESVDGTVWEVSDCTVSKVGNEYRYTRDTVRASSNGGSRINFSAGTKCILYVISHHYLDAEATTNRHGLLPQLSGNTSQYLRADGVWNDVQSGSGDLNYVHNQSQAATTWDVVHNLGKYPTVDIVDSAGTVWLAAVEHVDINTLTVRLEYSMSGKAFCN